MRLLLTDFYFLSGPSSTVQRYGLVLVLLDESLLIVGPLKGVSDFVNSLVERVLQLLLFSLLLATPVRQHRQHLVQGIVAPIYTVLVTSVPKGLEPAWTASFATHVRKEKVAFTSLSGALRCASSSYITLTTKLARTTTPRDLA